MEHGYKSPGNIDFRYYRSIDHELAHIIKCLVCMMYQVNKGSYLENVLGIWDLKLPTPLLLLKIFKPIENILA